MSENRLAQPERIRIVGRPSTRRRVAAAALPFVTVAALTAGCGSQDTGPVLPTGALVERSGSQYFLDFCFARPGALNVILGIDMEEEDGFWAGESHLGVDPHIMTEHHGQLSTTGEAPTSISSLFAQLAAGRLVVKKTGHIPGTSYACHRRTTFDYNAAGYPGTFVAADYSDGTPPELDTVDGPMSRTYSNAHAQDFSPLGVTN